jgi:hypothetical protein
MDHSKSRRTFSHRIALACSLVVLAISAPQLWSQQTPVIPLHRGYLFIDGQYVSPPYEIRVRDNLISVNGEDFAEDYFDLSSFKREGSERMGRNRWMKPAGARSQGNREPRDFNPINRISRELEQVSFDAIVILFPQEKPLVLYPDRNGLQLLGALMGHEVSAGPGILAPQDLAIWNRLVSEFQPSDEFVARAAADIEEAEQAANAGDRTTAANQLVAQLSYPLTVFAMVIVVLGFGHLLSNRPALDHESDDQTKIRQVVVRSLAIIALLSTVDVVWTLAASNAGTMRELNPLGSRLIGEPALLILFKLTVVGTSIGILYALHRRPVAQIASWWCCLLLTLLTARWVVFQSMFV